MFVRIVKMSFEPSKVPIFLENFNNNKQNIRSFDGCSFLELYQDKDNKSTYFTYSYWESPEHLETYRNSDLFKNVWAKTKILFNNKPIAWSVDKIESLK